MEPEFEPMLPPEPRTGAPAPLWVWLLVVALGGITVYAGYTALSARQLYLEGETVRLDVTHAARPAQGQRRRPHATGRAGEPRAR